jgi:predicted RNase H-like HicB family nuclease
MTPMKSKSYMVSDGELVLELTPQDKGWLAVRAPFHMGVITQAKSIPEAFEMARDAIHELSEAAKDKRRHSVASSRTKSLKSKSLRSLTARLAS